MVKRNGASRLCVTVESIFYVYTSKHNSSPQIALIDSTCLNRVKNPRMMVYEIEHFRKPENNCHVTVKDSFAG